MSDRKIKVLVIPADPAKPCELREIPDTLESYQAIVGGWIESAPVMGEPFDIIYVNEEGLLIGLPINLRASTMTPSFGHLFGDAVVVGGDRHGESQSISVKAQAIAHALGLLPNWSPPDE